jgi:hypothetical protein
MHSLHEFLLGGRRTIFSYYGEIFEGDSNLIPPNSSSDKYKHLKINEKFLLSNLERSWVSLSTQMLVIMKCQVVFLGSSKRALE